MSTYKKRQEKRLDRKIAKARLNLVQKLEDESPEFKQLRIQVRKNNQALKAAVKIKRRRLGDESRRVSRAFDNSAVVESKKSLRNGASKSARMNCKAGKVKRFYIVED